MCIRDMEGGLDRVKQHMRRLHQIKAMEFRVDDDLPRPKRHLLAPAALDPLGVAELADYAVLLRAEILRVEAEIARKASVRSAADTVFGRTIPGQLIK